MIGWVLGDKGIEGEWPEYDREVRRVFRQTFSGPEGRKALTYMLRDLGFFDEAKDPQGQPLHGEALVRATALRDYARRILEILGVLHEGNAEEMVNQMMNLPVWEKKSKR